jgi:hypothetical protein
MIGFARIGYFASAMRQNIQMFRPQLQIDARSMTLYPFSLNRQSQNIIARSGVIPTNWVLRNLREMLEKSTEEVDVDSDNKLVSNLLAMMRCNVCPGSQMVASSRV